MLFKLDAQGDTHWVVADSYAHCVVKYLAYINEGEFLQPGDTLYTPEEDISSITLVDSGSAVIV
jgi:hypothetical protein